MAKVKIKGKLPEGYKLVNGNVVRSLKAGGATKKTLQPISRKTANLEAEKGETALTDLDNDGSFELYNIGGKRHSEGGTPLNLPEQTFVYSDTRKMMFTVEELTELGITSKKKMTPAKVSKKFPLNEYIDILQDEHSDEIAIRSAEEMLTKNKLKLSQIAFMQEKKKDFSDGLPVASYPFLMSQGINPQEFEAQIQQQNNPQQGQMTQDQMAMGPGMDQLQQFTGPPQGGPTHTMPDGTVHPGATHEEYMAMQQGQQGPPPQGVGGMPPMAQGGKEIDIACPPQIARVRERECREAGMIFDRFSCNCMERPNPDELPGNTTNTQMLEQKLFPMQVGPVLQPRTLFGNIGTRIGNVFRPDHRDINPTHTRIDPITRENIKTYKNNPEIGSGPSPGFRPGDEQYGILDEVQDGKETKKQRKKRIKNYDHPYLNEYVQQFENVNINDENTVRDIMSSMNVTPSDTLFTSEHYDRNEARQDNNFDITQYIMNTLDKYNISYDDKMPFHTSTPDPEDGLSYGFLRNTYATDSKNNTLVDAVKVKKRAGGALSSFVYGGALPKAQDGRFGITSNGQMTGIAEDGGKNRGDCVELQKIRMRLLMELKQAEISNRDNDGKMGGVTDVIQGTHKKLQQVDRDIHECMIKQHKDVDALQKHEERRNQEVPLLKPIMPELNPPMPIMPIMPNPVIPNPDLAPGNTSRGQFTDIECNGPEAEAKMKECIDKGLRFDRLTCSCMQVLDLNSPGEQMGIGSVYRQGGCTSCQKSQLKEFVYGGDIAQDGMEMMTPPDRMTEEELMLQQLANYRMELMRQYQVTKEKVDDPEFVANKETQEKLALTFSTLEMKLDQVDQKAMELQNLIVARNQQIPLFPNMENTTAQAPPASPGEGYYRFGGDNLSKFVYGGSLPQYQKGREKKIDLKNAGYAKYIGNTGEYADLDHDELMKLVDDGVLKREAVSGSFYHANVCSDVNGNPVEGSDAESCKANGGYWVAGKRSKIKTDKTDEAQNPLNANRVAGRQAGNSAIDILNNPSYGPVIDKIFDDYVNNSSTVKRGNKSNKDNWVDIDQFGGKDGMMNAFFSVNSYLNEAAAEGLGFCGQLGDDGKEHPQQFKNSKGKMVSISTCKSKACCQTIDRENQKTLGVSIDEESARVFQGVYYSMDKLVNHDKDPDVAKLFEQIKVNPIGLKRSKKSKHFGADGKSPVSLVDGIIGGTSSGQFFTPEDDTNETVIEKSWENPCDQEEREAKRKECIAAGKQLDAKTCTCVEIPDDPGKTKVPEYETFPRDDRSLLNRLEQYNEIEQINPTLVQEDRFAPDPAYLDPRAKLASIEANVQEAIKNDPKNASFLMGKASELGDKVINEYENLNNKIYNNFATTAVDARNKEEEVNTDHLKRFFDESSMAEENFNVERQESKDAWVDAANQREENADEMYVRNFENPNFWFSPQAHEIKFYNEKGLDPSKAQNIDWTEMAKNAPKDENAAKLYWDHMRNKYGISTPNSKTHLNTRTTPEEKDVPAKYGREIDRIRSADLMRSKKKLRKWILGIK